MYSLFSRNDSIFTERVARSLIADLAIVNVEEKYPGFFQDLTDFN